MALRLYASNEDVKTASVINIATEKVEHIVVVGPEPEGVSVTPDGKRIFVTCEAGGDVFVIDAGTYQVAAHLKVDVRPRSVDFLPDGTKAFIPSESVGELNVIDLPHLTLLKTVALPQGSRPMRVRVAPDGHKVYVSNGRAGTVSVLDAASYELLANIKVGDTALGSGHLAGREVPVRRQWPLERCVGGRPEHRHEVARVKAGASPWGVTVVPRGP